MANSLEHRDDGSVALFINGDLQFDSNDEHIYHEALTLPALSIAAKHKQSLLKALIIGGGDGLVARELFKSTSVDSINLVDYDPQVLALAKADLANINHNSLNDPRLVIHINDAWEFVDQAAEKNLSFDIIISDLTVAEDITSARFHSVDWYSKLSRLLSANGILAVNAVSPSATPEAYWSVFNSILKSGLQPRPYHVHIPSFTALGFGQSWGYFIASTRSITIDEVDESLKELFLFPQELFEYQSQSLPALASSDILLHYFANASVCDTVSDSLRSSFSLDIQSLVVPEPDTGRKILPPELRAALAKSIFSEQTAEPAMDPQILLHDVLQLMPSLQREHTPEIIADFLEDPGHFLEAIDLPELVRRLLRRAIELPAQVVAELELLADKLNEWAGDHLSLLTLGRRVITVLTLVIVVGNLLYPDSVYGKGEAGHGAGTGHVGGHGGRGGRGGYGWGNSYGGGTYWNNPNRLPNNRKNINVIEQQAPAQTKNYNYGKGRQPRNTPQQPSTTGMFAPADPNATLISYLSAVVSDSDATHNRLLKNKADFTDYSEILKRELSQYETIDNNIVSYGSHELPKAEAIRRTQLALKRTISKIDLLSKQIEQLPAHIDLAKIALANLNQGENS